MNSIEKIRQEYEAASGKKKELAERLRGLEESDPDNFHQLWIMRDQIAYWEGKAEGLQFALEELNKGANKQSQARPFLMVLYAKVRTCMYKTCKQRPHLLTVRHASFH